ncbi:MAG: hypothetical protein U5K37_08890 [Natrialbaceae archaeon]|nr:hypothetical protein [Natrialbaceae archaeon]
MRSTATNNGPPMDVEIVLETRDADDRVVATRSRVVSLGFRETKVINMNPALDDAMDDVTVTTRRPDS